MGSLFIVFLTDDEGRVNAGVQKQTCRDASKGHQDRIVVMFVNHRRALHEEIEW